MINAQCSMLNEGRENRTRAASGGRKEHAMKKQAKDKAEGGRRKAEVKTGTGKKSGRGRSGARRLACPTLPAASDGKGKAKGKRPSSGKSAPRRARKSAIRNPQSAIPPALAALAVPIGQLHPDPENVRLHPERNVEAIKASLERFGQQAPAVYVLRKGKKIIIKGNGMLAAAKALGWKELAAVQSGLAAREAMAFAIADNRTGDLSDFDERLLAAQLAELELNSFDLADVGFTDAEYQRLLEDVAGAGDDENGEGNGGETASRKRGERPALIVVGHLKFEIPRTAFDRWLAAVETKVGNDPDRVVAEIKRRLKL